MRFCNILLSVFAVVSLWLGGTVIFNGGFDLGASKQQEKAAPGRELYDKLGLEATVTYTAFDYAMRGYDKLDAARKQVLVIIDFSKPSTEERLCVVDMQNERLLHTSHVAHGQGSGGNYATSFSNRPGSHQSSLGFFVTQTTYIGGNGYSLRLDGLEKGINDKARERAIVIHGADYCDTSMIESAGRLGRSWGCPALPRDKSKAIIDEIKEGALLYIYANDATYLAQSEVFDRGDIM